jgi:hypothetical protein
MLLANVLALVALLATGALAAPGGGGQKPPPPPPPPKPSPPTVKQSNYCGNGVTPYCCDNGALWGGYTSCTSIAQGATCDTTIVCCNANDSIQVCLGNTNVNV